MEIKKEIEAIVELLEKCEIITGKDGEIDKLCKCVEYVDDMFIEEEEKAKLGMEIHRYIVASESDNKAA